jgi:predicted nuclease of predicted toxin-antitoxin system
MKILVDMSLSPDWVPFLVEHGFQAIHWSKIGRPSAPDQQIFEYASRNGFAVFAHDLDFGTLLALQRRVVRVFCKSDLRTFCLP